VLGLYLSLLLSSSLKRKQSPSPSPPAYDPSLNSHHHHHQQDPYSNHPNQEQDEQQLPVPTGLPATLDTSTPESAHLTATSFDKGLNLEEAFMGISSLRKELARRARGHVLEVAVGTGRNLRYYGWDDLVELSKTSSKVGAGVDVEGKTSWWGSFSFLWAGENGKEKRGKAAEGGDGAAVGSREGEVLSFTGVDVSGDMLGVARDRVREAVPGLKKLMRRRRLEPMPTLGKGGGDKHDEEEAVVVDALDGRVRLVLRDALKGLPQPPILPPTTATNPTTDAPEKYDTIVQTFGLCSVADPRKLLANMAAKVQPDTGRIILLEHGRGSYDFVNKRLDNNAMCHFQKYGCWWNRDIEQLVRDATQEIPGLEVVNLERPLLLQWGTMLLIELRVKS
jgi:methyltransferase OMS1